MQIIMLRSTFHPAFGRLEVGDALRVDTQTGIRWSKAGIAKIVEEVKAEKPEPKPVKKAPAKKAPAKKPPAKK